MASLIDIEKVSADLLSKSKFYSKAIWNVEFSGDAYVQKNMRTTLGCLVHWDDGASIQISNKVAMTNNELFIDDVLIHELTHWYCKLIGEEYRDGAADFENRLKAMGITSTKRTFVWNNTVTMYNNRREKVLYEASENLKELNRKFHEAQ